MAAVAFPRIADRSTKVSFKPAAVQTSFYARNVNSRARLVAAGGLMAALRMPCRFIVPVFTLALVVVLGGCSADDPNITRTRTTTDAPTTTPSPSPEEMAEQAALEALANLVRVRDAAGQDPVGRDWEPEIRLFAADPYAAAAVDDIRTYATGGIRQVGDSVVEPEVTGVDLEAQMGPTVEIVACNDSTGLDIVRVDNGESILPPNRLPRFVWNLTVIQYTSTPGEPWLVTVLEPHPDQPC